MDIDAVACVQRALTGSEFLQDLAHGYDTTGAVTAVGLLEVLVVSERTIVDDIRRSKEKDDIRGARIILDYAEAHTSAAEDTFVRAAEEAFARLAASVAHLKGTCA